MHSTTQNVLFYVILAENILFIIYAHFYSGGHTTNKSNLTTAYFSQKIS